MVDPVEVVEAQVGIELSPQAAEARPLNSLPLSESSRSSSQPAAPRSAAMRQASFEVCAEMGLPCLAITSSAQA
jgi:hypothetical protein